MDKNRSLVIRGDSSMTGYEGLPMQDQFEEFIEGEYEEIPSRDYEPNFQFFDPNEYDPSDDEDILVDDTPSGDSPRGSAWHPNDPSRPLTREEERELARNTKLAKEMRDLNIQSGKAHLKRQIEYHKSQERVARTTGKGRVEHGMEKAGKMADKLQKVATLGGPVKFQRKDLYYPTSRVGYSGSDKARSLVTPLSPLPISPGSGSALGPSQRLKEAGSPTSLGRGATMPGSVSRMQSLARPTGAMSGNLALNRRASVPQLDKLKRAGSPTSAGSSPLAKLATSSASLAKPVKTGRLKRPDYFRKRIKQMKREVR